MQYSALCVLSFERWNDWKIPAKQDKQGFLKIAVFNKNKNNENSKMSLPGESRIGRNGDWRGLFRI